MDREHTIQLPLASKGFKRFRMIALVSVFIACISWSLKLNLGYTYGRTSTIYLQLNGNTHAGMLIIEAGGNPKAAWSNLKIKVEPLPVGQYSIGNNQGWADNAWTCISIDPPFHLKFKRADGTLTESIPAIWGHPSQDVADVYKWSSDGNSIVQRFNEQLELTELQLGSHWYLGGTLITIGWSIIAAIPGMFVLSLLVWGFTSRKMWYNFKPHECPSCGYDLSASGGRGCPECGWGRKEK